MRFGGIRGDGQTALDAGGHPGDARSLWHERAAWGDVPVGVDVPRE
jgi:hypothetical protein